MAIDSKLKQALKNQDLAAAQARWAQMSERERPSTSQVSSLLWTSAVAISPEIGEWLVAEGGDPQARFENKHRQIVDVASRAITSQNIPFLEWLVSTYEIDVNRSVVPGGPQMLEEALIAQKSEVATWLVSMGAKLNTKDMDGNTPLHKAASHFNLEALVWLVQNHADPAVENYRKEFAEQHVPEDGPRFPPPYNVQAVYDFISAYTHAYARGEGEDYPIPEGILDQRAVERVGRLYEGLDPTEWTEDHYRSARIHKAAAEVEQVSADSEPTHVVPGF